MASLPASMKRIRSKATEKRWRHRFPHYKSMGAFCCHGNQSFDPICPKTLCSLSPTPKMLHIKFDQDWPTGFRDIQVWKCGRWRTTDDDDDDGPLVYYKLTLWAFGSGEFKKKHNRHSLSYLSIQCKIILSYNDLANVNTNKLLFITSFNKQNIWQSAEQMGKDSLYWIKKKRSVNMSRLMTKPTKWHVRPAKTQISLGCPHEERLGPWLPTECRSKTLISLGGCPGWSESSLGTQSFCWFCHRGSSNAHAITF